MSPLQYILAENDDEGSITVIVAGDVKPRTAYSNHPYYNEIKRKAALQDESVVDLFDLAEKISKEFRRLSDQVTTRDGKLYFDGDEVDNSLTQQVLKFISEGVEDWKPLVKYFEKVQANPEPHSREQLYGFIQRNSITITEDGDVVFYKGVYKSEEDGEVIYRPDRAGYGIVDGVEFKHDKLPQRIGSLVEMPRSNVLHDPHAACHVGLHAATFDFANSFAGTNVVLEIHVNPRDVVSVPHHANKVRVCRYKVIKEIEESYITALRPALVEEVSVEPIEDSGARIENYENGGVAYIKTGPSPEVTLDEDPPINPLQEEFDELSVIAKRQKKSIKAVAPARGWKLVGSDPKDRSSWVRK